MNTLEIDNLINASVLAHQTQENVRLTVTFRTLPQIHTSHEAEICRQAPIRFIEIRRIVIPLQALQPQFLLPAIPSLHRGIRRRLAVA